MHKKNIALISLALAAMVTSLFFMFPETSRFTFLRFLYAPAILLTLLLLKSIHSPSVLSVWGNLVIFTLIYWIIIWILIAFISEAIMIRRGFHCLADEEDQSFSKTVGEKKLLAPVRPDRIREHWPDLLAQKSEPVSYDRLTENEAPAYEFGPDVNAEIRKHLKQFGKALKEVEIRRRQNFLLQKIDILNLDETDELLAKHAIRNVGNERSVKALLSRMESMLTAQMGSREAAKKFIELLKEEARNSESTPMEAPSK